MEDLSFRAVAKGQYAEGVKAGIQMAIDLVRARASDIRYDPRSTLNSAHIAVALQQLQAKEYAALQDSGERTE